MIEKERNYQQRTEYLRENKPQVQKFVYTLININNNQVNKTYFKKNIPIMFFF